MRKSKRLIVLVIIISLIFNTNLKVQAIEDSLTGKKFLTEQEMFEAEQLLEIKADLYQQENMNLLELAKVDARLNELGVEKIDFNLTQSQNEVSPCFEIVLPTSSNVEYSAYNIKTNYRGVIYECQVITGMDLGKNTGFLRTMVDVDDKALSGTASKEIVNILAKETLLLSTENIKYIGDLISTIFTVGDICEALNKNYSTSVEYDVIASYHISLVSTTKHVAIKPEGSSNANVMVGYFGELYKVISAETYIIPRVGGNDDVVTNVSKFTFTSPSYNEILTEAAKGYVDGVTHNQKITSYNYKIGSYNNRQSIVTINMRNHTAIYDPIIDVQ